MVITASSIVKVWLKDVPTSQTKPKDPTVAPPTPGISMSQLVVILFLTTLVNLFITHYQTVARWFLGFVGSWMPTVYVLINTGVFCIADALFQGTTSLNTAGDFMWPTTAQGGPMDA